MPRRPRRLRAAAEPVLRGGRAACGVLPRREPRPRRARRDRPRGVRRRRGRGRALDARACSRRARARSCESLRPTASATASSSSTRARATRSGSTCSSPDAARAAFELTDGAARARRPQPRPAGDRARGRTCWTAASRPSGTEVDLGPGRWLLNPGSVGQPRDGDPRAAWLLLDFEPRTASFRRVEYASSARRPRSARGGCPMRWRSGLLTASSAHCCWRAAAAASTRPTPRASDRRASRPTSPRSSPPRPTRSRRSCRAAARPATRPRASAAT